MGGSCFWCLTAADYPDYDGFKISFGQRSAQRAAAAQLERERATSPTASLPSKMQSLRNAGAIAACSSVNTPGCSTARWLPP